MALDTRDYWKEKHNKKTGYVEAADFRLSVAEVRRRRYRKEWAQVFKKWGLILLALFILGHVIKWALQR